MHLFEYHNFQLLRKRKQRGIVDCFLNHNFNKTLYLIYCPKHGKHNSIYTKQIVLGKILNEKTPQNRSQSETVLNKEKSHEIQIEKKFVCPISYTLNGKVYINWAVTRNVDMAVVIVIHLSIASMEFVDSNNGGPYHTSESSR